MLEARADFPAGIIERFEKHNVEHNCGRDDDDGGDPMMGAKALDRRRKRDHAQEARDDDHGIETGALPVTAAQMEPHAEFVEGEGEAEAIRDGAPPALAITDLKKEENPRDGAEQENAVVEMMDMSLAHVQEEIGNHAAHDENHEKPGGDEGEQKCREDDARKGA